MKKVLTIIVSAILCVCACFCITGCDCSGNKDTSQYVSPRSSQITVGITNAAPMNYKNADGKWIGFDTDLAVMTFNALGYNVMFKEIEWSNKFYELEAGTIDCIWNGFTANCTDKDTQGVEKERSEIANLSINYMINEQCVIKNKSVDFVDETSFNNKIIAFEQGSSGAAGVGWLEEDYPNVHFQKKACTSQAEAITEVNSGTADFAVVDLSIAENSLNGNPNIELFDFDYFGLEYYAAAFKNDNDGAALRNKVDNILFVYYEIGYLQELCTKYNIEYSRVEQAFESNFN